MHQTCKKAKIKINHSSLLLLSSLSTGNCKLKQRMWNKHARRTQKGWKDEVASAIGTRVNVWIMCFRCIKQFVFSVYMVHCILYTRTLCSVAELVINVQNQVRFISLSKKFPFNFFFSLKAKRNSFRMETVWWHTSRIEICCHSIHSAIADGRGAGARRFWISIFQHRAFDIDWLTCGKDSRVSMFSIRMMDVLIKILITATSSWGNLYGLDPTMSVSGFKMLESTMTINLVSCARACGHINIHFRIRYAVDGSAPSTLNRWNHSTTVVIDVYQTHNTVNGCYWWYTIK